MVVAGADVHDTTLLRLTLESIVVRRPEGAQNLCLDQGYDNPTGHETAFDTGYQTHIGRIGEEKLDHSGKNPSNYLGLLQLACALACSNWLVP